MPILFPFIKKKKKILCIAKFCIFNINPFSASPIFSQVQKFFLENLLVARFLCWRNISRDLFLEKGLKFLFHINMKKMKNQARKEIFRQMTMTLTLIQNVIYVQWTRKG